jgi:AraC family transcriptional regulator
MGSPRHLELDVSQVMYFFWLPVRRERAKCSESLRLLAVPKNRFCANLPIECNSHPRVNCLSPPQRFPSEVLMSDTNRFGTNLADGFRRNASTFGRLAIPAVNVLREGRIEPFLDCCPTKSSAPVHWGGIAFERYAVPAVFIPRHEHPENFLHVVLSGAVKYEVNTKGRNLRFTSSPGTIFLLPRGTVDEVNWTGPTQRVIVNIRTSLLTHALEEIAHQTDVELTERWNLVDRHISALLAEMMADLEDNSPAGTIYGESLANALAVYLLKRYAVRQITPISYKGGLPGNRLKRVLDYIAASLDEDISLAQLAAIAGMSPHYFSGLFKLSTGRAPHNYVLMERIKRAKQELRDPKRGIIDVGLDAGFQNPSHFARMFRKLVGTTPSQYRAEHMSTAIR